MPVWYGSGGDGGWATTTSSSTASYLNPFYGATGGTCATTTVVWVNTVVVTNETMSLDEYERQRQHTSEYYRQLMGMEEDRVNALYDAQGREELARQQQAAMAAAAMTREERAVMATREMAALAERNRASEIARARAKQLLLSKLSPEQKESFTKNNWFVVEGSRTKTKYRIRGSSYAGNIDVLDVANNVLYRLCVHCARDLPLEDHLVSQKIMLELAEDDIVRLANRHAA